MAELRIAGLPGDALAAAAQFHAEWLARAVMLLDPPRNGEVARSGGGVPPRPKHSASGDVGPLHHPADGSPPRAGEDLVLVFSPADHTHRGWRLAVLQSLARQFAPTRINAVASDDGAAIQAAIRYLDEAAGVTGQYLALDSFGAGEVIGSAP